MDIDSVGKSVQNKILGNLYAQVLIPGSFVICRIDDTGEVQSVFVTNNDRLYNVAEYYAYKVIKGDTRSFISGKITRLWIYTQRLPG